MTIYISWPIAIDDTFRPAYLAATGEAIQDSPEINANGDHYLVGSSRVTTEQMVSLQNSVSPDIAFGPSTDEINWIPSE